MTTDFTDENAVYHADTRRIGKSGLDLIAKSPAHYYAKYLDPNRVWEEQTPALLFGSAAHMAVFEPELFPQKFVIAPKFNLRTNAGKEQLAEFEQNNRGKSVISNDIYDTVMQVKKAIYAHPAASVLLSAGIAEQRIDWQREILTEDGEIVEVALKAKPDWLSHNEFIVDLKTTEDASPEGFAKSVWNYRYHVQAPFYMDAYEHQYGKPARGFLFIAVEKKPPYAVALYFAPPDMCDKGRTTYERDLRKYQRCLEMGEWPAYGTDIMELKLPNWAR